MIKYFTLFISLSLVSILYTTNAFATNHTDLPDSSVSLDATLPLFPIHKFEYEKPYTPCSWECNMRRIYLLKNALTVDQLNSWNIWFVIEESTDWGTTWSTMDDDATRNQNWWTTTDYAQNSNGWTPTIDVSSLFGWVYGDTFNNNDGLDPYRFPCR